MMIVTHIVPYTTDIGFSAVIASLMITVIGVTHSIGNVLTGMISDRMGRKRTVVTCAVLLAAVLLSLIWTRELWMLYSWAVIYGLIYGGIVSSGMALVGDTIGTLNAGKVFAITGIGWGIGATLGPIIAGYIFDTIGSYSWAFGIATISMVISAVLLYSIKPEIGITAGDSQ